MADKCHYAFFLTKKLSILLQSVIWLTSMLPLWLTHTLKCLFSRARIQARLHFGDTSYTKPDYQQVSEELAHTNTHTNTHTKWRTNHFQTKISRPLRKISRPLVNVSRSATILAFFLAARRLRRFACKECVSLRRRAPWSDHRCDYRCDHRCD